ncbi:MAG: GDP-mannose 4,6-dehydratase [Candidatus Bathyarchaeota archaeon]
MRVLVTGCTGFIGAALTRRLVEDGFNVYGLVRHVSSRELRQLEPVLDRVHLIEGDLASYHSVCSAIEGVQPGFVLHLGAITPVRFSFENPFPYISANFVGVANVVHSVLEKAPKARLVCASTAEVYGFQERREPTKEIAQLNPASPYAVSKEAGDQYVRMAIKTYGLKATILRPNNTYGRRREKGYLTEYLISSMLKGETCYVGAPESIRDYMYLDDHVNAYLTVLNSDKAVGEVFNVSPGSPLTNRDLAETVAKIIKFDGKMVYGSYPPGYPQRPAKWDPEYLMLDNEKIRRILGWAPSVTLEAGLRRTVENWKQST